MITRIRAGSLTRLSLSVIGLCSPASASVPASATVHPVNWGRKRIFATRALGYQIYVLADRRTFARCSPVTARFSAETSGTGDASGPR
jgi:hypothetical protein